MILKINSVVAVGIERCKLAGSVQQIGGRHGFFRDLVDTGQHISKLCLALAVRLDLVNAVAVCRPDFKHGIGDRFAGVSVMLIHDEVGALLVLHGQGAGFAGEQLHVVLPHIQNVRGVRGSLPHGIHAGFQICNQDLALFIGGAVEVMSPILNLGDTESNIFQLGAVRAGLDNLERGLDGVGKHELGVLVGVKLDNTLRLVDDVALTGFLRDHISAGGQLAQVNLAVFIGGKFLGTVAAVHGLDFKDGVGNDTAGVGGIHLDQPQSRLHIVEKQQLFDAVPCGQLHLLRGGVQDVTIAAGIHLHGAVGSGGDIRQQDLAKRIRAELAQGNTVPPDFKGDIGHGYHILAVVLDDPQSGQLLIYQSKGRGFAGGNRGGIGGIVLQPAGGGGDFFDLIGTGLDVVEDGIAREVGFGGIDCAAFNVLDLYHGSGQVRAGVGQLFNAKGAVRFIPEGDLRHLAVLHLDVLCGGIAEQVIQRGDTLIDGVVARKGQRNGNGAVRARAEGANGSSVRADYLKNRAAQRGVRTCLQLGDLQAGVRQLHINIIPIVAVCGQAHGNGGVGVAHIILELTVFVLLCANSVEHSVFVDIGGKGQLDAAGLTRHRRSRVQDFELARIAVAGAGGGNGGNILVLHVHDSRSFRHGGGVRERHADGIVAHPGVGMEGEHLLLILLAIHGDGIGYIPVGRGSHAGRQDFAPGRATRIDVL